MNYQKVRKLANKAVSIVDARLFRDAGKNDLGVGWCDLQELAFDATMCDKRDVEDNVLVTIRYRWRDVMNYKKTPSGEDGDIMLEAKDLVSPEFVAGMLYADILRREKFLK